VLVFPAPVTVELGAKVLLLLEQDITNPSLAPSSTVTGAGNTNPSLAPSFIVTGTGNTNPSLAPSSTFTGAGNTNPSLAPSSTVLLQ
jgi:hypothetical protein